ncbi:zinc-binding dehydrogenase [Undibacterium sp. TS12]|uniref:zinc-binding dehydrogenase n=1 Tax=Undibacterium sp. TS12 TaxID=2908202 RepID=UPI001F4CB11A|nr:zinc-binding dehydrogenase [Undibacterium sp. TS12]MCH8620915.1 zinc-binding dehydrogenase [Undibacterium sp. TS12]
MRAIIIKQYGGTEQLDIQELPIPAPNPGQVLIQVKAFGLNRAELYMRQGSWGDVARVSGIECTGVVAEDPSGRWQQGQKVLALMGGMGRSINGSYAEYTCVPASNVVAVETGMSWESLAALPESYATAWSCLHGSLDIQPGQTLLIRGASSALGQAAINIAANAGVSIIATTRSPEKAEQLTSLGARQVILERGQITQDIRDLYPQGLDAVLDLIGNSSILDSLRSLKRYGRACLAGFLGGPAPIADFNPIRDMPCDVYLSFFASFMLGTPEYPLSAIPFQEIIQLAEKGTYQAAPAGVFEFEQIRTAHEMMEASVARGKLVVRINT